MKRSNLNDYYAARHKPNDKYPSYTAVRSAKLDSLKSVKLTAQEADDEDV